MDVLIGWPGGSLESFARLLGGLTIAYLLIMWAASILWVHRDIRARTTDPTSHMIGVAIAVIFPVVGLPIYLILRPADTLTTAYDRQLEQEALLAELQTVSACPNCRRPVMDDFAVCAFCATPVKQGCARCGRQLRLSWRVCPYCATPRVPAQAQASEQRYPDGEQQPSRVSASREAAVEAIRRAAGRSADEPRDETDESPRPRRPADSGEAPRPRPRRSDGDR